MELEVCVFFFFSFIIGLASATSQHSNWQNWFWTRIAPNTIACWETVDRPNNGLARVVSRYLLKCDALSCERVVKTFQTSLRRNKKLRSVRDFSPSMLLYGTLSLFRTNFPRCHASLSFLTSSLASPMIMYVGVEHHLHRLPISCLFDSYDSYFESDCFSFRPL